MSPSTVTVVMPVCNEHDFIARTFGAILAKNHPPGRLEAISGAGLPSYPGSVHLFRSRLAAGLRGTLIRNPRAWLPAFPAIYGVIRLADRLADNKHGQIVLVPVSR